jgi:SAM-dependent methyltransferase
VRQARHLIRAHTADIPREVAGIVEHLRALEQLVQERFDITLKGLRMLDVGAGQRLLEMKYFAVSNEVVGVDRDVIVEGFDLPGYCRMLVSNGPMRTSKTIVRKLLEIDRRQTDELMKLVGGKTPGRMNVLQMDASDMSFDDNSFDFVYSFAVFQHLEDPARVVDEMRRVLAPGGVVYLDFILYTSRAGALDLRLLGGGTANIPSWAHLRRGHMDVLQQSAYLNRLRLHEWRSIFDERLPGHELILMKPGQDRLEGEARDLQEAGELGGYEMEELLTTKVAVVWRKQPPDERDLVDARVVKASR